MRFRLGLLIGFGVGYVLGARAGRARYEQIRDMFGRAKHSEVVELATDRAKDFVDLVDHEEPRGAGAEAPVTTAYSPSR